jgi:hypothetical protein
MSTYCLSESGVLLTLDPGNWAGDKGYAGNDMVTPFKKPAGGKLLDWQKKFNKQGDYSFIAFLISPLRKSDGRRDGKLSTIPQAKMNVS